MVAVKRVDSSCALARALAKDLYSRQTPAEREEEFQREMAELGIIGYEQKFGL